jgi:hypothetical protein
MRVIILLCLFFLAMVGQSSVSQEKKMDPELLDELVGGYKVEIQGQKGIFVFMAEEGQLKGAPAGEKPSLLEPVEGEELTFVSYSEDGTEQRFKFLRNEEGKIAKCILSIPAAGLVVDMFKLEK